MKYFTQKKETNDIHRMGSLIHMRHEREGNTISKSFEGHAKHISGETETPEGEVRSESPA